MTHVEPSPKQTPPAATGTFPNAWTLFRIEGIPVRLDRSWILIAAAVSYLFFGRLQVTLGDTPASVVLPLAVLGALGFFASILAHEMGHALTSLDRDVPVVSITLFALGGVTESTREARRARDEFVIVGIGPFISLVLAGAFGLLYTLVADIPTAAALAGYLAWANLALAIFNIVPGYPLDGGRLLRSILWGVTGRPHQATRWAARVGQVFASLLIALGLLAFATQGGGGLDGLWEVLIGIFLFRGAAASHKRARMRERLEGRGVVDVMGSVPPALQAQWTLTDALHQVQQRPSLLWPVDDPVSGGLLLEQIDAVPSERWPTTLVRDVALAAEAITVSATASLDEALAKMAAAPHNMVIVVDNGRAVGLLTPSLVADVHG
jgi:Zn-dependent protease